MKRFLCWKWLLRGALVLSVLALCGPLALRFYVRWRGESRLAETIRSLNESDPDWTKDDLCRIRNGKLPLREQNSFLVVKAARAAIPADFDTGKDPLDLSRSRPANELLRTEELHAIQRHLSTCAKAVAIARTLVNYPEGGREISIPEMPLELDLEPVQRVRFIAWLLQYDALVTAHNKQSGEAVRDVRATLNAARSIGDEPSILSQLVRIACAAVACRSAELVLGLTEPSDGLAELQAELLREAEFPRMYHSFRAERASSHQIFRLMETGDINRVGAVAGAPTGGGLLERLSMFGMRTYLPDDHVFSLTMLTAAVEAARLPFDEQWTALKAVPDPVDGDRRHFLSNLLAPAVQKIGDAGLRCRGDLLATAAAIACERHRQRTGRWPESLEAISKDLLPNIPIDPFTGQAIRLKHLTDGIVVYSIGPDGQDDGGAVSENSGKNQRQTDFGVRLWDLSRRRSPPPPAEPPIEADPAAPGPSTPDRPGGS